MAKKWQLILTQWRVRQRRQFDVAENEATAGKPWCNSRGDVPEVILILCSRSSPLPQWILKPLVIGCTNTQRIFTRWREDMNFIFEWQNMRSFVKYCFCLEKIKFISSSRRVMFFLLYRQKEIYKIIEGNYRNYVIDKLTCEIMESKPLVSRM